MKLIKNVFGSAFVLKLTGVNPKTSMKRNHTKLLPTTKIQVPYLPMYNARPCIIRTPILDYALIKKKKKKQKTKEVVLFGNTQKTTT